MRIGGKTKTKKSTKSTRGRRPTKLNLDAAEAFGAVKASYRLMAHYFGVDPTTIVRRMKDEKGEFYKRYQKGLAKTKFEIANKQIEVALSGNVSMLIWLGKQYLDQRDKQELSGSKDNPIRLIFNGVALPDKNIASFSDRDKKE